MCCSASSTAVVILFFSSLTRCPASRLASFGAPFSQRSLIWVAMPSLRASQRSRKIFHSDSLRAAADSDSSADRSSRPALLSESDEKSASLGTVYVTCAREQQES